MLAVVWVRDDNDTDTGALMENADVNHIAAMQYCTTKSLVVVVSTAVPLRLVVHFVRRDTKAFFMVL